MKLGTALKINMTMVVVTASLKISGLSEVSLWLIVIPALTSIMILFLIVYAIIRHVNANLIVSVKKNESG